MTEHLTLNTVFHAAFRRTIARFDAALAEPAAATQARVDQLKTAWDFFEEELHHHHSYEEQYFWPALELTDADLSSVAELDQEHGAMREALAGATEAMVALQATPSAGAAATARTAVADLGTVLLTHLDHEERDLEPISAAYAHTPPLKKATARVKKAHFKYMGNTIEWMRDGADPVDIVGMKKELPPPVVFLFSTFGGRRYRREIAPVWSS